MLRILIVNLTYGLVPLGFDSLGCLCSFGALFPLRSTFHTGTSSNVGWCQIITIPKKTSIFGELGGKLDF